MSANYPQRHYSLSTVLLLMFLFSTLPNTSANVRLCGQRLTRTLLSLCRNQLCGGFVHQAVDTESAWKNPILSIHHSVKRDGIATRCCMNRCTISYLKTYCCAS